MGARPLVAARGRFPRPPAAGGGRRGLSRGCQGPGGLPPVSSSVPGWGGGTVHWVAGGR